MSYWQAKRAVVTGGSSGLGRALARTLAEAGARVAIAARGQQALDHAVAELNGRGGEVFGIAADVTIAADVDRMAADVQERLGGVDFFCHAAGRSMRGNLLATSPEQFQDLWQINCLAAVRCVQALATPLTASRGHVVLIGSLASKVAPRYLGGYPASKFALAAVAQQLRLESSPRGVHTLFVCPGPIARQDNVGGVGQDNVGGVGQDNVGGVSDADVVQPSPSASERRPTVERYADQAAALPPAAQLPGGGAKLRAIAPDDLARRILHACERRQAELVVPARARLLFALSQLSPRLGDWLLGKNMADE